VYFNNIHGHDYQREEMVAAGYKSGDEFTVVDVEVCDWYTNLSLIDASGKELKNKNSCLFSHQKTTPDGCDHIEVDE
jgi:hypothetical protein